jgi:hypothetical protein
LSSSWVRINGEGGGDMAPDSMGTISDPKIDGQGIAIWKEKKIKIVYARRKTEMIGRGDYKIIVEGVICG